MENTVTILIKNTSYVVGFKNDSHYLLKNGQVAYKGNEIIYVGKNYEGPVDQIIDANNGLVIPGLINCHVHLANSPAEKGFIEDRGSRNFHMLTLYEYLRAIDMPYEDRLKVMDFSLAEILPTGATTIYELGLGSEEMVEKIGNSGLRAYIGLSSCPSKTYTPDGKRIENTKMDLDFGYQRLEENIARKEKYEGSYHDRIRFTLFPGQDESTPPEFLREVKRLADLHKMKLTIHVGQSIQEYEYIIQQYGVSPAQYLVDNGICGPDVFWTHYVLRSGHHLNPLIFPGELELMAETKTNLVHCPWVLTRRGFLMESMQMYLDKGINVVFGTDTFPQDMLNDMRSAATSCKIAESNPFVGTAATVFNMATVGAAKAFGRDDLGRLAPGAKADIVIVDTNNMEFCPYRDPIKILVFTATRHNIDKVIVDGNLLVEHGKALDDRQEEARKNMQEVADRMWLNMKNADWAHRTVDELSPMSFPVE